MGIGVGAGYADDLTHLGLDFISHYYEYVFGPMVLVGLFFAFIGCVGWAAHISRRSVKHMAWTVFLAPWVVLLLGYPIEGFNPHGYSAIVMLLILPATLLSIVLGIMAVRKSEAPK